MEESQGKKHEGNPSSELLSPNEYLFSPAAVKRIRTWAEDKRVIFIDYNGVVGGFADGRLINPKADETLSQLKEAGYSLVLWTTASDKTSEILENNDLSGYFDFAIYGENYLLEDPEIVVSQESRTIELNDGIDAEGEPIITKETVVDKITRKDQDIVGRNNRKRLEHDEVLQETPWLSDEEKELSRYYVSNFAMQKQIHLLLPSACLIDDNISASRFKRGLPDNSDRYTAITTFSFNPREGIMFADDAPEKRYFSPAMVPEIIEKFPPANK